MPTPHYTAKTTGRDSMIGWLLVFVLYHCVDRWGMQAPIKNFEEVECVYNPWQTETYKQC